MIFSNFDRFEVKIRKQCPQTDSGFGGLRPSDPYRGFAHRPHWGTSVQTSWALAPKWKFLASPQEGRGEKRRLQNGKWGNWPPNSGLHQPSSLKCGCPHTSLAGYIRAWLRSFTGFNRQSISWSTEDCRDIFGVKLPSVHLIGLQRFDVFISKLDSADYCLSLR